MSLHLCLISVTFLASNFRRAEEQKAPSHAEELAYMHGKQFLQERQCNSALEKFKEYLS